MRAAKRAKMRLEADQRRVGEDTDRGETGKNVYADGRRTRLSGSCTGLVASLGAVDVGAVKMSTVGVGNVSRGNADDGSLSSSGIHRAGSDSEAARSRGFGSSSARTAG